MTTVLQSSPDTQGLRVLDPDLPFLASEAAVDLDNLLSGRSIELSAIRQLAVRLKNSIEVNPIGGGPRSLMDPATLTVLGEAVVLVAVPSSSTKVEDVLSQVMKIADELTTVDTQQNQKDIEQARDFCVALSKTAASYRMTFRDLRLPHPFRR